MALGTAAQTEKIELENPAVKKENEKYKKYKKNQNLNKRGVRKSCPPPHRLETFVS